MVEKKIPVILRLLIFLLLILINQRDASAVIELEALKTLKNVAGSPFKGPEDAPVVIAVFDDFQ